MLRAEAIDDALISPSYCSRSATGCRPAGKGRGWRRSRGHHRNTPGSMPRSLPDSYRPVCSRSRPVRSHTRRAGSPASAPSAPARPASLNRKCPGRTVRPARSDGARNVAAQQLAIQPVQVAHQLVEVIARAVDAEIDADVTQLRVIVYQQHLLLVALHRYGKVNSQGRRADSALGAQKCEYRTPCTLLVARIVHCWLIRLSVSSKPAESNAPLMKSLHPARIARSSTSWLRLVERATSAALPLNDMDIGDRFQHWSCPVKNR